MAATTCSSPAILFGIALPKVRKPRSPRFGQLALAVFLVAQFADGLFTYLGVTAFGIGVEANPLVGSLMTHLGHGPGLVSAKMLAAVLGVCLYLRDIHGAVAMLAGFYLTVAIAPWTVLLFF
jgi:hypothetical protein